MLEDSLGLVLLVGVHQEGEGFQSLGKRIDVEELLELLLLERALAPGAADLADLVSIEQLAIRLLLVCCRLLVLRLAIEDEDEDDLGELPTAEDGLVQQHLGLEQVLDVLVDVHDPDHPLRLNVVKKEVDPEVISGAIDFVAHLLASEEVGPPHIPDPVVQLVVLHHLEVVADRRLQLELPRPHTVAQVLLLYRLEVVLPPVLHQGVVQ
mmetsp:Transcript_14096/g.23939  ORF Transcript_14096/g.23939 Transcript_14096/m.23939 type:complete len:209 (-) Transcript_14096:90-716(-)